MDTPECFESLTASDDSLPMREETTKTMQMKIISILLALTIIPNPLFITIHKETPPMEQVVSLTEDPQHPQNLCQIWPDHSTKKKVEYPYRQKRLLVLKKSPLPEVFSHLYLIYDRSCISLNLCYFLRPKHTFYPFTNLEYLIGPSIRERVLLDLFNILKLFLSPKTIFTNREVNDSWFIYKYENKYSESNKAIVRILFYLQIQKESYLAQKTITRQ